MGRTNLSVIASATAVAASLLAIEGAGAQPIVVTSQRFTFQLPGQASQFLEPVAQGTIDRDATLTQTLNGGFGGSGVLQTVGTARGTTSWSATTIGWSAQATIANTIQQAFDVDDYPEVGLRAQMITEVWFQVLATTPVQLTRSGASSTSSGFDFIADFGRPFLLPLDSMGVPIPGAGFEIGFSDPVRELQAGFYVARIRSAAIMVTSLGNAPVAGSATIADGATLVVVPAPTTLGVASMLAIFAGRRRR